MAKSYAEIQSDKVTIREVYSLIDSTQRSMMVSVDRVERKVDNVDTKIDKIESVTISDLQKRIATMEGKSIINSTLLPIGISLFFSIMNLFISRQ
jgi:hypothetical protein